MLLFHSEQDNRYMLFPLVAFGVILGNLSVQNRRTTSKRRWQMYRCAPPASPVLSFCCFFLQCLMQHWDHFNAQLLMDGQAGRTPALSKMRYLYYASCQPFLQWMHPLRRDHLLLWEQHADWITIIPGNSCSRVPTIPRDSLKSTWLPLDFTFFSA